MPDTNLGTATGYLNLDIHNWNNALDDARESLREFENSSNSMGDTLRNTQQATNGASDALRNTSDSASRARSAFDGVRQVMILQVRHLEQEMNSVEQLEKHRDSKDKCRD